MKKLKRILPLLLALILSIGLYGCGTKSPSNTVKEYLEQIKKGENGDISNLVNKSLDESNNKEAEKSTDATSKKLSESMKKITYTVNSEKIDGNKATVNVKVNGPDLGNAFLDYLQKAMTLALSQAFSEDKPSQAQTDKQNETLLMDALNNMKYTDRTGDISLSKVDGKWKVNNDDSLAKLLLNMDSSMFNTKPEEKNTAAKEVKQMTLNKPFNVETEYGNYTLTIEGARVTDKRNEFSEKKVTKVVFLDYSYANQTFGEKEGTDLYIDESAFQVLDDEGNVLSSYPAEDENRVSQNAPAKGKSKGSIAYGLTTDSKNLNVTFVRGSEKVAKIIVPIK